jgi:predicted SPOUT superfamily RNA methylase MTH1
MLMQSFQNNQLPDHKLLAQNVKTSQNQAKEQVRVEDKRMVEKMEHAPDLQMVDVTTVSIRPEEIEAPKMLNFFGYKIDLSARIADLKDTYIKNYSQTMSHNLMVARFAEFKTAAVGALLTMLGVPSDEIEKMQKKTVRDIVQQNKMLFEENEYNAELLGIIGGSKKQMKGQARVLGEIRNQLMVQATNLGLEQYYNKERILEIKLAQCRKILEKFMEEKTNLEYQGQIVTFGLN